jgi:splicing factor 3B subunit 3
LNEFQERKEMTAHVTALTMGPIPEGRQRSRFLAVGCDDNTVRVISLDPDNCMQSLSMQAITATPESLVITDSIDPATGVPTLYLNIGLQNGIFLRTVLDNVTGVLSDSRLRFLGAKPVKLFKVLISGSDGVLALSTRPWLSFTHNNQYKLMPLSYQILEYGSSFATEHCPEGLVAIAGNTLRILSVDKLDAVFNQLTIPLSFTPRQSVVDPSNKNFYIIESDTNTYSPGEKLRRKLKKSTVMDLSEDAEPGHIPDDLPAEQFGLPIAGSGHWASCVRVINPFDATTMDLHELDNDEAAFRQV